MIGEQKLNHYTESKDEYMKKILIFNMVIFTYIYSTEIVIFLCGIGLIYYG
jgi:hypothetical protein